MTDGAEYQTRSTWKEGDKLNLDIDPRSHPAWTGGAQQLMDRGGRVSRFQRSFPASSRGEPTSGKEQIDLLQQFVVDDGMSARSVLRRRPIVR